MTAAVLSLFPVHTGSRKVAGRQQVAAAGRQAGRQQVAGSYLLQDISSR